MLLQDNLKSKLFQEHECNICGKKFKTKLSLMNHIRFIHQKKSHFKCDFCPEGTEVGANRQQSPLKAVSPANFFGPLMHHFSVTCNLSWVSLLAAADTPVRSIVLIFTALAKMWSVENPMAVSQLVLHLSLAFINSSP